MNLFKTLISVFVFKSVLSEDEAKPKSLCEDPVIHSADRLSNDTYRVYRGDYYWELDGLSGDICTVKGPFKVSYPNMIPIDINTAITTVITGLQNGVVYKWKGQKWWSWSSNGLQIVGGRSDQGYFWPQGLPEGGFSAAFNDGDLDKKGYPMMIGFDNSKLHYFDTRGANYIIKGTSEKGGLYGEYLPSFGITAAMAFPSKKKDVKYYIYLFKSDQYCFRPINGEKSEIDCRKKWKPNKQLFGCFSTSTSTSTSGSVLPSDSKGDLNETDGTDTDYVETGSSETGDPLSTEKSDNTLGSKGTDLQLSQQNILFILILIIFLF